MGDLSALPISFLEQPLESAAAASAEAKPAVSAQDADVDSDDGGQDPRLLDGSMYMLNDSEPGELPSSKSPQDASMTIIAVIMVLFASITRSAIYPPARSSPVHWHELMRQSKSPAQTVAFCAWFCNP